MTHQLSRAHHTNMGHRMQELDMLLWHFYNEIRNAYGADSETAVLANRARWHLWDLRVALLERCRQEYGANDPTETAYYVAPAGLGDQNTPPWAAPADEAT